MTTTTASITKEAATKATVIAKGLSEFGGLKITQIKELYTYGLISKPNYIQIAIAVEFGVLRRFEISPDEAEDFANRWSPDAESKKIKPKDIWQAFAVWLDKYDGNYAPYPQLSLFEQQQPPILEAIEGGGE